MSDGMTFLEALKAIRYFEKSGFNIEPNERSFCLSHKESRGRKAFHIKEEAICWVQGFVEAKEIYEKASRITEDHV